MFVTSHFPAIVKGSQYIMELAQRMPDVDFLVLGEKGEVKDLPQNIKLLGRVYEREKMALYYSLSNATIIVSKAETFSMPVAESLCCGTPVVGFKAGGPESICIKEYCEFVDYGDIDSLQQALSNMLLQSFDRDKMSREAILKYSKKTMADGYIEVYNHLMQAK